MTTAPPMRHLSVRINAEYVDQADRLAEQLGIDRSELIRRCIRNGLDGFERFQGVISNPALRLVVRMAAAIDPDTEGADEIRRIIRHAVDHNERDASQLVLPGVSAA